MKPPFPSSAKAYADSIHQDTSSRHHPDARLTILPLPSLASLYPLDSADDTRSQSTSSSSSALFNGTPRSASSLASLANNIGGQGYSHLNLHTRLLHTTTLPILPKPSQFQTSGSAHYPSEDKIYRHHQQQQQQEQSNLHHQAQEKDSSHSPLASDHDDKNHHYMGSSMESLLDAIEVHTSSSASSSSSCSPLTSPSMASASALGLPRQKSPSPSAVTFRFSDASSPPPPSQQRRSPSPMRKATSPSQARNSGRMSISHLLGDDTTATTPVISSSVASASNSGPQVIRWKMAPKESALAKVHKRKWSNLSSANFEEERNAKNRRSISSSSTSSSTSTSPMSSPSTSSMASLMHSPIMQHQHASRSVSPFSTSTSSPAFDSSDPSTRSHLTTVTCLHASVAQKSYGSEKRFLCPPPVVKIQTFANNNSVPGAASHVGLSDQPQVAMSVICESGDTYLGQRSMLDEDNTGTFRFLYVTGTAKAKAFNLKLKVYDRACLPNGFVANDGPDQETESNLANMPEPYAVFDSAPIAIISKPSKKTAKARNVSSCILAGSLVSLFNRINSQTVRTKYMSVEDNEFCAKNSTWSAFSISIVAPSEAQSNGNSTTAGTKKTIKSHHRSQISTSSLPASSPITYGTHIMLTETATGLQSDPLVVCKVENGRILEDASGPICQMQKVALMAVNRNTEGQRVYLSAVGSDQHQAGRFFDHATNTRTLLRFQPSNMTEANANNKLVNDDFLCWTIVGISKFEYTF